MSREALQEPQAIAIKTAKSSLLQARRHHATQQVLAQTSRGHASEHQPPLPPQRVEPKRTDTRSISAAIAAGSRQRRMTLAVTSQEPSSLTPPLPSQAPDLEFL